MLISLLILLAAAPVEVTTTTVGEVRADDGAGGPGYAALLSRTLVDGGDGDVSAQARLDLDLFRETQRGFAGEVPLDRRDNFRLERLVLRGPVVDGVTLEVGDSAVQVGRGLALCLKPAATVGLDSALRGVRLAFDGVVSGQVFGGIVNPQNTDPLSEKPLDDVDDVVAGVELGALAGPIVVGVYGVAVVPEERLLADHVDGSGTAGITLQAPALLSLFDLGLEIAVQEQLLGGVMKPGAAVAVDVTTRLGSSTLLVEGLWLSSFAQRGSRTLQGDRLVLAQPPTLERPDMNVMSTDDARALRGWWQSELSGVVVDVTVMGRQNSPDSPAQVDVMHAFSMVTFALPLTGSRLAIGGGARDESAPKGPERTTMQRLVHGDVDVEAPLWTGAVAHGNGALQLVDAPALDARFARGSGAVVVDQSLAGLAFGGGLELGVDTQQSQATRRVFAAAIAHVDVDDLVLRFVVGDQRGGLRCSGGVCRQVPAFSGARVEVVARF
ncbi:MAG: DUF6029 family protein [Deltaproteobacteria bacterium]|nr:DUF6029 family protein [Deltaproteobacteria bacterium]